VLLRRRHGKNSLILSASATGIIVGLLVSVCTGLAMSMATSASALPVDSSAQTVTAKDSDITRIKDSKGEWVFDSNVLPPMPDLAVTVSQTKNLLSQAVVVSWTGAKPSSDVANFLQIAQCWGEDPKFPGHPDRTTCQYGAFGNLAAKREGGAECVDQADIGDRTPQLPVIDEHDYQYSTGLDRYYTDSTRSCAGYFTSIPYEGANGGGVVAPIIYDPEVDPLKKKTGRQHYVPYKGSDPQYFGTIQNYSGDPVAKGSFTVPLTAAVPARVKDSKVVGVDLASNQFYTAYTTNEVNWAGSSAQGKGSIKFEIQTGVQAPGLGCGSTVVDSTTGLSGPQSCWLVVIPRGTSDSGSTNISKSGLFWDAWKHNIAVKLDFKPTAQRCSVGGAERQLAGSELAAEAISSWQPKLCYGAAGSSFVMSSGNEASALVKASGVSPSPMALTTRPLKTLGKDPVQYAPVAISSLAISFSIDRLVKPISDPKNPTNQIYIDRNTEAFETLNLTPRLVAKLLTGSYWESLPKGAPQPHIVQASAGVPGNARVITQDEDFLQVNDKEWRFQDLSGPSLGDVLMPSGQSDEAVRVWEYVMSDPDAVAFLRGTPDPWGMRVNPYYATSASEWSPAPMVYPVTSFPKADPITKANTLPVAKDPKDSLGDNAVNLITWRPFTTNFENGAFVTLRGDGLELGEWNDLKKAYGKAVRNVVGKQRVMALTTAAAASRYQTITASLLNPAGKFVSPSTIAMAAAAAAMQPSGANPAVAEFNYQSDSAKGADGAYPLTMPVYAALNPLQTDAGMRASYAAAIRYAVQDGQVPGTTLGQLPEGYTALTKEWIDQAMASATAIEMGISPLSLVTPGVPSVVNTQAKPMPAVSQEESFVPSSNPTAVGSPVTALAGRPTPADPVLGLVSGAVPAGLLSGFAAAGAVPLYSRFRRRP
jgi:hypothetical protein